MTQKTIACLCALLLFACPASFSLASGYLAPDDYDTWNSLAMARYAANFWDTTADHLAAYVQPVDQAFQDGALRVHLIDVLWDGVGLVAAWTITNTGTETLYLLDELQLDGLPPHAGRIIPGFLAPGETRNGGIAVYLTSEDRAQLSGGRPALTLHIAGMRVLGEMVSQESLGLPREYDDETYIAVLESLRGEGKLVVQGGRYIPLDGFDATDGLAPESTTPPVERYRYESTGLLETACLVQAACTLTGDAQVTSLLPQTPDTAPSDGFTLRLTGADLSPTTLALSCQFIFPSKAAAEAFHAACDLPAYTQLAIADETGRLLDDLSTSSAAGLGMPVAQPGGGYTIDYDITFLVLAPFPDSLYLVPDPTILSHRIQSGRWVDQAELSAPGVLQLTLPNP